MLMHEYEPALSWHSKPLRQAGRSPHKHWGEPLVVPCGRPQRLAELAVHAVPQVWQFMKLKSVRPSPVAMPVEETQIVPQHCRPDAQLG